MDIDQKITSRDVIAYVILQEKEGEILKGIFYKTN